MPNPKAGPVRPERQSLVKRRAATGVIALYKNYQRRPWISPDFIDRHTAFIIQNGGSYGKEKVSSRIQAERR